MTIETGTWDRGELGDLFFWVQRALQKYVENAACRECIRLAREGLEQIQASLEGVGRDDVEGLCTEMLRVIAGLESGDISGHAGAGDALLRAALRMPGQLDTVDATAEHLARAVSPLVNELRALRGAAPLIAAPVLFTPRLVDSGAPPPPAVDPALQESRRRFQQALLDLLRDREPPVTLGRLADAAAGIAQSLPDGAGRELFGVTAEFAAALARNPEFLSPPHKRLLGRVDRELGQWLRWIEQAGDEGRDFQLGGLVAAPGLVELAREALLRVTGPGAGGMPAGPGVAPEPADSLGGGLAPAPRTDSSGSPGSSGGGPVPAAASEAPFTAARRGTGPPGEMGREPVPDGAQDFDERRLLGPVRDGQDPVPVAALERLVRVIRGLEGAFGGWKTHPSDLDAIRAVAVLVRSVREDARAAGAPRLGEFASLLESFLDRLAAAGGCAGTELLQVVEDAVSVLPELLAEIRDDLPGDTPVMDIVLRIRAMRDEPLPGDDAEEAPETVPEQDLGRIRQKGAQDMARLAAAFAALDGEDGGGQRDQDAGAAAGLPGAAVQAARSKLSEVVSWHQHVVEALTGAAGQLRELEDLLARLRQTMEMEAAYRVPPEAGNDPGLSECLDAIEQTRLGLAGAIGNASAALLQQRRATQALEDRLEPDDGAG
ncbi:Chemotaxis protein histidine kinase CheA domain-containing protein [Thioalkalivibrio nitratireducens DSM 14787]|uniref:Chemotaxis protein histidine kinase CheA domain-containing protein n=1 Tax=Thioalkalivibrio nitratireducens (strain DSM 14787 / UNIQEM 213 / ALEN2) TaxID=1255043 RepID=L0DSN4_THIND|nr:hypothetical protein [Thioalkalivibrio nitratireducens]AGA32023.1 Chemotaxis protein histidine kinase CheA domain-containing protein [Thioalkalivibrio nitratireducens DSM 14787]